MKTEKERELLFEVTQRMVNGKGGIDVCEAVQDAMFTTALLLNQEDKFARRVGEEANKEALDACHKRTMEFPDR